ncbi:Co-chaperone Hsc20 [Ganoderma leucocontextum]|nr:Co-chaperone Hsc20 [Ganoderma leucocontextum]
MMMFRLPPRALASLSLQTRPVLQRHAGSRAAPLLRSCSPTYLVAFKRTLTSRSDRPKRCPSCSTPLPSSLPVCPNCFYIAPIPESMTYHEILGTPYEPNPFVVDPRQLKDQFRAAQAVVHPDRWVRKPEEHQAIAGAMSARVNEALHHLSNPLRRAEYILACEGLGREETDKLEDMDLLMEVMEAREGLASAESEEDVTRIQSENQGKIEESLEEIEQLVGSKDWEGLRAAAVKLKYLQGIESAAAAWPASVHDH